MKRVIGKSLVVLWLAAAAGCGMAGMGEKFEPIEVGLVDVIPSGLTLFEQNFRVVLRLKNLNAFPVKSTGLRFTLTLNGVRFLTAVSGNAAELPRLGDAVVEASATTSTFGILKQAIAARPAPPSDYIINPNRPFSYIVKGTVFQDDIFRPRLPFENRGQIDLPKLIGAAKGPPAGR
jgi:LEA14-like dessication related protein